MPCPTPKIVELQNGEFAFGSRRIAGAQEEAITAEILTRGVSVPGLTASLSSVFALDLFLNNVDRHDRNFLMVEDRGALRMYTFDFGRCLFYHGRLEQFPSKSHQTRLTATKLRRRHGFDLAAANSVLDRIMGLSPAFVSSVLGRMSETWLTDQECSEFSAWWASEARNERVAVIRKGMEDGTLF